LTAHLAGSVVDVHCHIGELRGIWGMKRHTARQHVAMMDANGVHRSVVFSFCSGLLGHEDFVQANDRTAQAVSEFPDRLVGFAVVNPMFGERATLEMERASTRLGLLGLKLHPVLHGGYPIDSDLVTPILSCAESLRWPVLCHTDLNNQSATPYRLVRVARRFPSIRFIMAHMGIDPAFMEASLEEAVPVSNVSVDTSTITDSPGIIKKAVRLLGEDRVLFGSDAPGLSMELSLRKVHLASLDPDELQRVLGQNALALLGDSG